MHNSATPTNPIDIIAAEARATAASFGITCTNDMAQALIARLIKRIGGQKIYIPTATTQQAKLRTAKIRAQFTGSNIAELAQAWRISPRQVRRDLTTPATQSDRIAPAVTAK